MRRISAAAGVSIGLINHHFPSKSGLVAVTYETLALSLQDSIRAQAENRAVSPRARLERVFPRIFRSGNPRSAIVQRLAGVLEHGGAFTGDSRRARSDLRKYRSILESLLGKLAESGAAPRIQTAPCGHRPVRSARRPVGGTEFEPDHVQAARGDRTVRGLGEWTLQRRISAAVDERDHGRRAEREGGHELKNHYRVVVIGGGMVGTSVLYHLARLGWTDIALIERSELTAGLDLACGGGLSRAQRRSQRRGVAVLHDQAVRGNRKGKRPEASACTCRAGTASRPPRTLGMAQG